MTLRARLRRLLAPHLKRYPTLWQQLVRTDQRLEQFRHTTARLLPVVIRPEPRALEVAITAFCNLRCIGCRYGRDFMNGQQLTLPMIRDLLDDARAAGIWNVRFYGGEPLLHPELPRMVEHAKALGIHPYVTTNAILLRERIEALYAAGLRHLTIGFYGVGAKYDDYVQRKDRFARVEASIAAVRARYGMNVNLRINWLLMRPSCNLADLQAAWTFAERYSMPLQVDLIHYSLPYFAEGPDRELQFREEDRPAINTVVQELLRLKETYPERFTQSLPGLRSIPDWLLKGPRMRVACDSHQMIWVGADGTVQLCYVTFKLGNLHERRLREMLFTPEHRQAARDSFRLACPNCHCHYDRRVQKDAAAAALYGAREKAALPGRPANVPVAVAAGGSGE